MSIPDSTSLATYWNGPGQEKVFNHPVPWDWLNLERGSQVLDLGCGYGRLLGEIVARGGAALGADASSRMVERAQAACPTAEVVQCIGALPWPDRSVDIVLMITVLTSAPADVDQRRLLGEAHRVLRPGGRLFISDLPLQWDARNLARYRAHAELGDFGVFNLPGGATLRHHSLARFQDLVGAFETERMQGFEVVSMNGNPIWAVRWLGRKIQPPAAGMT